jgi:tetratricopeptide (TPR) repeat protein
MQADRQLAEKKLMTPVDDNAWSSYKKILALDPDHQQAIEGIDRIKETYKLWARNELKKGNFKHAAFLLQKALQISPDDTDIQSILAKIDGNNSAVGTPGLVHQGRLVRRKNALSRRDFYELLKDPYGVDELLAFAKQQIAQKKLTKPESDSAFTVYKIILERYPTHQKALAGIKKIKDTYVLWARHEMKRGNIDKAEYLYSKALEVAPGDLNIMSALQAQFNKAKNVRPRD